MQITELTVNSQLKLWREQINNIVQQFLNKTQDESEDSESGYVYSFDEEPTENSNKLVQSGGLYNYSVKNRTEIEDIIKILESKFNIVYTDIDITKDFINYKEQQTELSGNLVYNWNKVYIDSYKGDSTQWGYLEELKNDIITYSTIYYVLLDEDETKSTRLMVDKNNELCYILSSGEKYIITSDGVVKQLIASDDIEDAAVTEEKLAVNSVTNDKIEDYSIDFKKINDDTALNYIISSVLPNNYYSREKLMEKTSDTDICIYSTSLVINSKFYKSSSNVTLSVSSLDGREGKDIYVYAVGNALDELNFEVTLEEKTGRKIGGFHCLSDGNILDDSIWDIIYENPVKPGVIMAYSGSEVPVGWLLCDGSEVNRVDYDKLFSIIGTSYGVGNDNTTFNIPNLKGKVLEGYTDETSRYINANIPVETKELLYTTGTESLDICIPNTTNIQVDSCLVNYIIKY